eukprot:4819493-Amphidinium_carterae.1
MFSNPRFWMNSLSSECEDVMRSRLCGKEYKKLEQERIAGAKMKVTIASGESESGTNSMHKPTLSITKGF